MGNRSAVDGFLFDDWWDEEAGPSEIPFFAQASQEPADTNPLYRPPFEPHFTLCCYVLYTQGTGLYPKSQAYRDLYSNWSQTTTAALAAIQRAGGFSWSNVNCMLDPLYPGMGRSQPDTGQKGLYPCGLTKTNGSPRANNKANPCGPSSQRTKHVSSVLSRNTLRR